MRKLLGQLESCDSLTNTRSSSPSVIVIVILLLVMISLKYLFVLNCIDSYNRNLFIQDSTILQNNLSLDCSLDILSGDDLHFLLGGPSFSMFVSVTLQPAGGGAQKVTRTPGTGLCQHLCCQNCTALAHWQNFTLQVKLVSN